MNIYYVLAHLQSFRYVLTIRKFVTLLDKARRLKFQYAININLTNKQWDEKKCQRIVQSSKESSWILKKVAFVVFFIFFCMFKAK